MALGDDDKFALPSIDQMLANLHPRTAQTYHPDEPGPAGSDGATDLSTTSVDDLAKARASLARVPVRDQK
jgi:hypothetical protein